MYLDDLGRMAMLSLDAILDEEAIEEAAADQEHPDHDLAVRLSQIGSYAFDQLLDRLIERLREESGLPVHPKGFLSDGNTYSLVFYPENFYEVRAVQRMADRHHTGGEDEFSLDVPFFRLSGLMLYPRGVNEGWFGPGSVHGSIEDWLENARRSINETYESSACLLATFEDGSKICRKGGSGLFDLIDEEGVSVMSGCSYSFHVHDTSLRRPSSMKLAWFLWASNIDAGALSHPIHVEKGLLEEASQILESPISDETWTIPAWWKLVDRPSNFFSPLPEEVADTGWYDHLPYSVGFWMGDKLYILAWSRSFRSAYLPGSMRHVVQVLGTTFSISDFRWKRPPEGRGERWMVFECATDMGLAFGAVGEGSTALEAIQSVEDFVLPGQFDAWKKREFIVGSLVYPDLAELYMALGEPVPWDWADADFLTWANEQA